MKKKRIFIPIVITLLVGITIVFAIKYKDKPIVIETPEKGYVASEENEVILYDTEFNEVDKLTRGMEVDVYSSKITNEDVVNTNGVEEKKDKVENNKENIDLENKDKLISIKEL